MRPLRGGIACALFFTLLAPRAEASVESYGLVFVIDGARGDALRDYALNGHRGRQILPNIRKHFVDQGVWVKKATSVFPTITGAAMPALLTGCTSERHGLPSLYFFDRRTKRYPVLYVLAEAFDFDSWLSPKVRTIWEYFEGPNDAISFGPAVHRGSDAHISILYNLKYKPLEIRGRMRVAWRELKRKLIGGLPAHLIVVYNGWFDHMEHANRVRGEAQIPEYEAVDGQVGAAVSLFMEMLEERRRAGATVRYFMALAGDHGQQDINEFHSIDTFVRERQGARVVDKIWTQVFGQKIKGSVRGDLGSYDLVVAAGEGHALLYFPSMTGSGQGPADKDWERRPSLEMLRSYPYRGRRMDLPAMAAAERAVSFAAAMDTADETVHIYGAGGESTIERRSRGGLFEYRYRVVSGADPWGYAAGGRTQKLMDEAFHSSREWQLATLDTDYPDAVVQVYHAFGERERSPDMYLSAGQFISIGDLVDEAKSRSKHGGLTVDETWTTLAFAGTDLSPGTVETARTLDLVPTMLALMGKDFDPDSVDGEPIPQIMAQLQEARAGQLFPGELPAVQGTIEQAAAALEAASGDEVYSWAGGLQSLLKRPGLPADWVREVRRRSFDALSGRADPPARALVNGENAAEFLARRRPDLPRPAAKPVRPAEAGVVQGYLRDLADATLRKIFELLEVQCALASPPAGEQGREALAQLDRLLAVPDALHRAGFQVLVPVFSFGLRRNGPNLRYEGLQGGAGVDAASRRALAEFIRVETSRASGLRALFFDRDRALMQAAIGERLAQLVRTLEAPPGEAALDPELLAAAQPPGEVRELLLDLGAYGRIAALSRNVR